MRDIVLAKIEGSRSSLYPPLGLLHVASGLERAGYNVKVFHERYDHRSLSRLIRLVGDVSPLFVGFSTTTGPELMFTVEASKELKIELGVPIVWGGIHPTILPEECLALPFVDNVVIGEGEETAARLADALRTGKKLGRIAGLGFKAQGRTRIRKAEGFIQDLDIYPPSWHLVDVKRYLLRLWGRQRILPIITSRGCPHRCGFCYNFSVHKRHWRGRSVASVVSETEMLEEKHGIEGVMFCDDNFFVDIKRANSIVSRIEIPWSADIRADYISNDLVAKLKGDGCFALYIGAESGSPRILEKIEKDVTKKQIRKSVRACKRNNVNLSLSFIVGFPGEDSSDREMTMNFIDELKEESPGISVDLKIYTPYPGTPLWSIAVKYGFKVPTSIREWTAFSRRRCLLPWIKDRRELETMSTVCWFANGNHSSKLARLLGKTEMFRWRHRLFKYPFEITLLRQADLTQ